MHKGNTLVSRGVQGFRSIINLMAVQLSCDGLELQSPGMCSGQEQLGRDVSLKVFLIFLIL